MNTQKCNRWYFVALASVSLLCLSGGTLNQSKRPELPSNLLLLPITPQDTPHTCGPGVVRSLLLYYGEDVSELDLIRELKTTISGTISKHMAEFLTRRGFQVTVETGMSLDRLKSLVDAGIPVIVMFQAWSDEPNPNYKEAWNEGHFSIVVGFDEKNLYFMDPSTTAKFAFIPFGDFLDRWHDLDGTERVHNFAMTAVKKDGQNPELFTFMK